jgi:transposase
MVIGAPKDISDCRRFFLEPRSVKQRMYEALRAYFVERRPSQQVARDFGYTVGSFQVLCHHFRRESDPVFFVDPQHGPTTQPKKSAARELIIRLRKQNYSVYEISEALKERQIPLSPTAVREVLKEEGFAALPRRRDDERPKQDARPTIEPIANVANFNSQPRQFTTVCGGLFLFVPDLISLGLDQLAADLPGSKMIPAAHALRCCLALKLWTIERKSHAMALVADPGLALFPGLNAFPKKSYLSEYSSRITPSQTAKLLGAWHDHAQNPRNPLFVNHNQSLNLDFHSVPFYGEDPMIERHYVSARSRRQPSILVFLAQDPEAGAFCYSNADLRKGEEAEEIFRFLSFWKNAHGTHPQEVVFDSRLTTYANLARLNGMGISFITLRRRSSALLREIANLPGSAWRVVELDVPTRKYRTPRVFEQTVVLEGCKFRQLFIKDLGHDEPTILLANGKRTVKQLIQRYAQRMLIENALSDAVRFFHMDALSSAVGMKVDFDMALLVIASGLYRLLARRMRGYSDAQARQIFRDLVDMPAQVTITDKEIEVSFLRRAHLPIILASGLTDTPVPVPWWNGLPLRLTTYRGPGIKPARA